MGLKEFTRTKIRSNVMGIPVTIIEEVIGKACRRQVARAFQWNLNKKTSTWISVVK
jgi:SNF family Na+-dependent transporter